MAYAASVGRRRYVFDDLRTLLTRASPDRSGDRLAGLPGRFSVRLQPNHPTDDPKGIGAAILDGLLYGCGDAVIGVNPATDSAAQAMLLLQLIDELRERFDIPSQSCVLPHVTTTLD